jgi:hypothetical protein
MFASLTAVADIFVNYWWLCCAQSKNFRAISREDLSAMFREETGHDMTQLVGSGEWIRVPV